MKSMVKGLRRPKRVRSLFGSLSDTIGRLKVDGNAVLLRVASDLFESLDTAVSLSCEILLRYGDLDQLVRKTVSPSSYSDPLLFRDDYQAVSFLKKVPFAVPGLDPEGNARKKFREAEEQCRRTNERIRNFLAAPEKAPRVIQQSFPIVVRKIQEVLGVRFPSSEWLNSCRFGPGAFNAPGASGLTSHYDKLQVTPSCTNDMMDVGAVLVTSSPPWARSLTGIEVDGFHPIIRGTDLKAVPGNRVAFVPKTAVTHRAIAIEPLINIYSQLGIGSMIRRRLKRVGVDLDDQTPNQESARLGSIDGSLATIDLSSASDTVAKELVRALLPESWFYPMDLTRSKVGFFDKTWIRYEKFSSMGNGFTFELESLIFWAISYSACVLAGVDAHKASSYGDDIVVPSSCAPLLIELLEWYGFSLNRDKTFFEGSFRESCGMDYYDGVLVRPFFQKELPDEAQKLFKLANGIRRLAHRRNNCNGCDRRMYRAWSTVVYQLPRSVSHHCVVPAHAGDTDGLISNWDEAQTSIFVVPHLGGWEGWFGLRYQACPLVGPKESNFLGGVASLLYRLSDGDRVKSPTSASPRQRRGSTYQLRDGAFYGPWTELGPWC
jgi:hypothetical protein